MNRTLIESLHDHIDEEIELSGWVHTRRDHGKLIFIDLRDRSGIVQMVALPNHKDVMRETEKVRDEWVVRVRGKVQKRPEKMVNEDHPMGDVEVEILELTILSEAKEMPFEREGELNLDTYLDHLPLTLRTDRSRAIFRVQAEIIRAYRDFLLQKGFIEFQSPKLVGKDAEGGAGIFKVEYFHDTEAYLATSPQFYKQIMVGAFERVFTTGNVFRAEKHSTSRHINEYTSMDIEMGFIRDHHDIMNLEADLMRHTIGHLKKTCAREFELIGAEFPSIPETVPNMKLREAQEILEKEFDTSAVGEPDLEPQHERQLCEYAKKEFDSDFIFITHYPVEKRPMYTYEDEEDPGFTKSFDLLMRGVEITTGGQRIHDYDTLVKAIEKKGFDPENFSYYLQAFKFGMPPHGGWGMGLERLTAKFLSIDNIKEVTLFPREINRIDTLLRTS